MTKQRRDEHSTEFGLWLRAQPEIDSRLGFVASNLDYIWRNYKTGRWMLIEEKRHNASVKRWQRDLFDLLDKVARLDPDYCGFHVVRFANTSPDDGEIFLDGEEVTPRQLVSFLLFEDLDA